jgi:hypothetical protein
MAVSRECQGWTSARAMKPLRSATVAMSPESICALCSETTNSASRYGTPIQPRAEDLLRCFEDRA